MRPRALSDPAGWTLLVLAEEPCPTLASCYASVMFETDHEVQAIDPEDCGSFAVRLFHARSSIPLTQEELAERAGIPGGATAIGHYEAGRREPGLENLRRLVWALGEAADYLLATRPRTDAPYLPQGCRPAERTGAREQREWEASFPEAAGHLPSG